VVKTNAGTAAGVSVPVEAARGSSAARARGPLPPAHDPWREPVPGVLQPIRDRLDHQARLTEVALRPVYSYARQNPGDPRPWLLAARAYAQLDWWSDSVDRYLRAYRIDAGCRGDPRMLPDLLKAAAHPVAGRSAASAIREIYGAEALPAVAEERRRRTGDREALVRLDRLAEELSR
jgi:hypothetical protein